MARRTAGFTLIEIMVVLVIVTIMAAIAVASLPAFNRTGEFDTEQRRLMTLLLMAREEAVLQSTELGLAVGLDHYEFMRFNDLSRVWQPISEPPFQPRRLPEGVELELTVTESSLRLGSHDDDDDAGDSPGVMLLSSGEITPFDLTMSMPELALSRTIHSDGYRAPAWIADEN